MNFCFLAASHLSIDPSIHNCPFLLVNCKKLPPSKHSAQKNAETGRKLLEHWDSVC
eukprot:m.276203 g.276203  ORF g.276203 m.276203 type:complete len:56 (-) comp80089_c0_seq1:85-252(-)